MSKLKMKLTAVEQVSDGALIDEVNRRLKSGAIDQDTLATIDAPDTVDDETGGGTDEGERPSLDFVDADSLDEAAARYARGDYPETLWNLEKALGRKFIGLGDLILGKR